MNKPARLLALLLFLCPASAGASWPYRTEPAGVIGQGRMAFSLGISRTEQESDALPGGRGILWTYPEAEARLGVGPQAEILLRYEYFWLDPQGAGAGAFDSGDLRLWTKLVLLPGRGADLALRFGVKLPNASQRRGLGTNETDAFLGLLYSWVGEAASVDLNAGLGILGDETKNSAQDDVFTWAGALRVPLPGSRMTLGGETFGYAGPFGLERKEEFVTVGAVFDYDAGPVRFSTSARRGFRDAESWGWLAGITWTTK